jgi:hypothetical protein
MAAPAAVAAFGTATALDTQTSVIKENTGLRTYRNNPLVIRLTLSRASTPTRQDSPMSRCAL